MRKLLFATVLLAPMAVHAQTVMLPNIPSGGYLLTTASPNPVPAGYRTALVVFPQGEVATGSGVSVVDTGKNGPTVPGQLDEKTHWTDGSVRTAVLTFQTPPYRANAPVARFKVVPGGGAAGNPISLATFAPGVATVTITPNGGSPQTIDVAVLYGQSAPSYWMQGPLATEGRWDVPVTGFPAMHVSIDARAYADGTSQLDVQFDNDLAHAHGGAASYMATIKLGTQSFTQTISNQQPFTDWHHVIQSAPLAGYLLPDMANLEATGLIPHYPLTLGVQQSEINAEQAANSCAPLSPCGITPYMPETGGRQDIGLLPRWDGIVIESGAGYAYAMQQADVAAGAIPWHVETSAGVPVNVDTDPTFWADDRCAGNGGKDCSPMSYSAAINGSGNGVPITPQTAHMPSLSYLAYLMTGERYYLDELTEQAGFALSYAWTAIRQDDGVHTDLAIGRYQELRAGAWSIREVMEASLLEPDGSAMQTYFQQATSDNFNWAAAIAQGAYGQKGAAQGWLESINSDNNGGNATWQNDFVALVAEWGIHAGVDGASGELTAQTPFLLNRFLSGSLGFSPYDGASYYLKMSPNGGESNYYQTWAQIETGTEGWGYSNTGVGGCVQSPCPPGTWALDYGVAATSVVNGLPSSPAQQQVLAWMNANPAATYGPTGNANPAWVINP